MHAANMVLEAKRWIEKTHPEAWNRRGGRDHIWLSPNDEGTHQHVVLFGGAVVVYCKQVNHSLSCLATATCCCIETYGALHGVIAVPKAAAATKCECPDCAGGMMRASTN